ncbi:MAG: hypothetical protein AAGJ35_04620 [Myxococcota bacterium]
MTKQDFNQEQWLDQLDQPPPLPPFAGGDTEAAAFSAWKQDVLHIRQHLQQYTPSSQLDRNILQAAREACPPPPNEWKKIIQKIYAWKFSSWHTFAVACSLLCILILSVKLYDPTLLSHMPAMLNAKKGNNTASKSAAPPRTSSEFLKSTQSSNKDQSSTQSRVLVHPKDASSQQDMPTPQKQQIRKKKRKRVSRGGGKNTPHQREKGEGKVRDSHDQKRTDFTRGTHKSRTHGLGTKIGHAKVRAQDIKQKPQRVRKSLRRATPASRRPHSSWMEHTMNKLMKPSAPLARSSQKSKSSFEGNNPKKRSKRTKTQSTSQKAAGSYRRSARQTRLQAKRKAWTTEARQLCFKLLRTPQQDWTPIKIRFRKEKPLKQKAMLRTLRGCLQKRKMQHLYRVFLTPPLRPR